MLSEQFEGLYAWISHHPHWSGVIVFFIALLESLAVVGLIVPGVAMMFAAGALIATGALPFVPVCLWAIAGAIVGDALSFGFGRLFHRKLRSLWPFRSYPELLDRGVDFFCRYGGRSILFGRFVGPVRAVVPMVAGMLQMPVARYVAVSVFSAILWAPAYLLPGMAFGASLELASKVAGRLVLLLILLLAIFWVVGVSSKWLYVYFQPRAHGFVLAIFDWSKNHPVVARFTGPLIDPRQRDYPGLLVFALILTLISVAFTAGLADGAASSAGLQFLRIPWGDAIFTAVEGFASEASILALFAFLSMWLLLRGYFSELIHWTIALLFSVSVNEAGRLVFPGYGGLDDYVLRGSVMYGFLAVLTAGSIGTRWRWVVYSCGSLFCITLVFARVYLGAGSPGSAFASLLIAFIWLNILGVAYRRHSPEPSRTLELNAISLAALAAVGVAQIAALPNENVSGPKIEHTVAAAEWRQAAWASLPAYRLQLFGRPRQPLNLQWAARLDDIASLLADAGWRQATPLTPASALQWLSPDADVPQLPVLPHFFESERDALIAVRNFEGGRYLILRLWASHQRLEAEQLPVWIGSVSYLRKDRFLGILSVLTESDDGRGLLRALSASLSNTQHGKKLSIAEKSSGNRTVLLISTG